ncbi:hypothetical protein VA599_01535 [Chromobacterium sp. TRC.1.1.SA]|uniref:Uncharacterized protein n=1 Tax=Chromobacterium indicum TaxID=3110228 RepID=A0ABV0CEX4_9NEIS
MADRMAGACIDSFLTQEIKHEIDKSHASRFNIAYRLPTAGMGGGYRATIQRRGVYGDVTGQ